MKRMAFLIGIMCIAILVFSCGSAMADSGTYRGIDWDLTDGVLTLGNGGTQTMTDSGGTMWTDSDVTSVVCDGTIVCHRNMNSFFRNHTALVSANLSGFDTSDVRNMGSLFGSCNNLTSLDISSFDTSNVTYMGYMFDECSSLTSLDLSGFNTSNVKSMFQMFYDCSSLISLDISGWDTSNVTDMLGIFTGCEQLVFLNGISELDTSNVVAMGSDRYMQGIFENCRSLKSLDLSHWNTSKVDSMGSMFHNCSSLTSLNVSGWDTSNVTSMYRIFNGCSGLTSLDVTGFDTSNVTNMESMFKDCSSLTSLDVSGFNTSNVTNMSYIFNGCSSLTSLDVANFDTSNVTNICFMFSGCRGLTSLDVSAFETSHVTNMSYMFNGCTGLTLLDVSAWDTSQVTNMDSMFYGCRGLTFLDLSDWDTGNVTSMNSMFYGCSGLISLDLSVFDTSNVTNMSSMFRSCSSLTSLDVTGFDTSNVTNMDDMFYNCMGLTSLDVSGFDTSNATNMVSMFYSCDKLKEVTLGDKYKTPIVSRTMTLPTPPLSQYGVEYTGKWIREDGTAGPYTPAELRDNYTSAMAGKWVWEPVLTDYVLHFSSVSYPGAVGEMAQVTTSAYADYQLVANQYVLYGFSFDHWDDGKGHIYADQAIIPANTYQAGDMITLNLVMTQRDTSVNMQDGKFTFSIYGNEKAFFDGVPAGTSYQVFEENLPDDWVLIAQSNTTGLVESLEESNAIFLNKYQPDIATLQFTGRKLMDEQPAKAGSFTFELWEGNILLQTKSVTEGGFVQFDMLEYDCNDVGIHTYTIKELVGSDETVLYDGHEETIAVAVTTLRDPESNVTKVNAEVTYSDGTYPNILFENWTKPGELSLKKLVDDLLNGHQNDEFKFRITFKQDNGLPLSNKLTYSIVP